MKRAKGYTQWMREGCDLLRPTEDMHWYLSGILLCLHSCGVFAYICMWQAEVNDSTVLCGVSH